MKIKEGFILRDVAGNKVVVPIGQQTIDFNGMMELNETGAFLFEKMLSEVTRDQLVDSILEEYEVSREIAEVDVDKFIAKVEGEDLFE